MKKTRKLDAAYERLEPAERCRLVIEADARDDERELARLARSCPRYTYSMIDRDFLELLDLAYDVAHGFAAEILVLAARLDVTQAAQSLAETHFGIAADEADFAAYQAKGSSRVHSGVAEAIRQSRDNYLAFFDELEETLAAEGSIAAHGFAGFCRDEVPIEPKTLLRAGAGIAVPEFEWFLTHSADAEPVAEYQAVLTGVWRYRLGLQSDPTPTPSPTATPATAPAVPGTGHQESADRPAESGDEPEPTPEKSSVTTPPVSRSEPKPTSS